MKKLKRKEKKNVKKTTQAHRNITTIKIEVVGKLSADSASSNHLKTGKATCEYVCMYKLCMDKKRKDTLRKNIIIKK